MILHTGATFLLHAHWQQRFYLSARTFFHMPGSQASYIQMLWYALREYTFELDYPYSNEVQPDSEAELACTSLS